MKPLYFLFFVFGLFLLVCVGSVSATTSDYTHRWSFDSGIADQNGNLGVWSAVGTPIYNTTHAKEGNASLYFNNLEASTLVATTYFDKIYTNWSGTGYSLTSWYYFDTLDAGGYDRWFFQQTDAAGNNAFQWVSTGTGADITYAVGSACGSLSIAGLVINRWYHIGFVFAKNGTLIVYVNGTRNVSSSGCSHVIADGTQWDTWFGKYAVSGYAAQGNLDDLRLYSRELSSSEMYEVAGGLVNYDYINISTPLPVNNSNFTVSTIVFNLTANSTYNFNCSFRLNGTINETKTYTAGSNVPVNFTKSFSEGSRNYQIYCVQGNDTSQNETTTNNTFLYHRLLWVNLTNVTTSLGVTSLSNGSVIEYSSGIWYFRANFSDSALVSVNYTVYNHSNVTIKSDNRSDSFVFNTSDAVFSDFIDFYNISVKVIDALGFTNSSSIIFKVNDTSVPVCTNLADDWVYNNTDYAWNSVCTDENFYSFNITCSNGFNYSISGLNNVSYTFSNSTLILANTSCNYSYSDGHTRKQIPAIDSILNNYTMVFDKDISITPLSHFYQFDVAKSFDRYFFLVLFSKSSDFFEFNVKSVSNPIYFFNNAKYDGWLVIGDKWLDFENKHVSKSIVTRISDKEVKVSLWLSSKQFYLNFSSIGYLNIVNGTQSIESRIYVPSDIPSPLANLPVLKDSWFTHLFTFFKNNLFSLVALLILILCVSSIYAQLEKNRREIRSLRSEVRSK